MSDPDRRSGRRVAVLDYGMGNLRSVAKALEAAGGEAVVTADTAEVLQCDALCVPGQGIFGRCMANLASAGQDDLVRRWIDDDRPYLGICLGLQILFDSSDEKRGEGAAIKGLSILEGQVRRLTGAVRVPHMGWSEVGGEYFYFDHSYAVHPGDESLVAGWCTHGDRFAAAVRRGWLTAVQFHPEKSGRAGIALLTEWLGTTQETRA
ncbi:MAG: imidazole glycerol phosphate synthase subunit HisH [Actinomycetota bacterium]